MCRYNIYIILNLRMIMSRDIYHLINRLRTFNIERNWDKDHNPKDLILALVGEVGELAECYQWMNNSQIDLLNKDSYKKKKIEDEIADVIIYLMILAYKSDIDLLKVVEEKIEKNEKRFPVEK